MSATHAGQYEIRWNDAVDGLSLYCPDCEGVVCDVEHGDTLAVLEDTAREHECGDEPGEIFPGTRDALDGLTIWKQFR